MPTIQRRQLLALLVGGVAGGLARPGCAAETNSNVLRVGLKSMPQSLDPLVVSDVNTQQILGAMYESLTSVAADGRVLPGLATAWDASDRARLWRISLRRDVTFHSGRPFTAWDVKRTFEAATAAEGLHLATIALARVRGFREMRNKLSAELSGVTVLDDHTLEVACEEPCAIFPFARFNIVDAEAIREHGPDWHRRQSVGTGPYRLSTSSEGIRIDVVPNPHWRGGAQPFDRVSFVATGIGNDGVALFNNSQIDFSFVDTDALRQVADDPGFKRSLIACPRFQLRAVALDARRVKAFADLRVRQAMSLLIDREAMVERFFRGLARVHNGVVPPALLTNERLAPLRYDPVLAKDLLAQAGFPEGRGLEPFAVHTVAEYRREFVYYVSQWNNAGIPAKLVVDSRQDFIARSRRRDYDAFLFGWTAAYPDPMNFLDELFSSRSRFNPTGWANAEFDAIIDAAMALPHPKQRATAYKDAEQIVMSDMPVIPLVVPDYVALRSNALTDGFITPFGGLNFT